MSLSARQWLISNLDLWIINLKIYSIIFCEAVAIYGVIIAIILLTKADGLPKDITDMATHDKVIIPF